MTKPKRKRVRAWMWIGNGFLKGKILGLYTKKVDCPSTKPVNCVITYTLPQKDKRKK